MKMSRNLSNQDVLFMLHEMKGIGWKTIDELWRSCEQLNELCHRDHPVWKQLKWSGDKKARIQQHLNERFLEERLRIYEQNEVEVLTYADERYPVRLKEMASPPWVLYMKGDSALLHGISLAIVGTRHPTAYGLQATEKLASACSRKGMTIVSGLASGIDAAAHAGGLKGIGKTIAVMGTGMDRIYPRQNQSLYQQIRQDGLVVTEVPFGTPVHPGLFPQRNRIIAGLSVGTLVVEAAEKSGSLITADYAMENARDVFAVPGSIFSKQSGGTHLLIQQGAKLVCSEADVLEEYLHIWKDRSSKHPTQSEPDEEAFTASSTKINDRSEKDLSEEEANVMEIMTYLGQASVDDLLEKSKFSFGHLQSVLLSLLMKKEIIQVPGSLYIVNQRE
ncbi:DNA-processing protein DprA [Marinicrinis sediminis]|uniref:DNA-processing protein DprA n=1 Tax=Marinicrinis sediminis TaxID=1652465 RepID=A0ABW5R5T8_9BACL